MAVQQVAQPDDRRDRRWQTRTLEGNIALFSHGQFGGVLAARWIGLTVIEAQHFPLGTTSLSIFAFDPHHYTQLKELNLKYPDVSEEQYQELLQARAMFENK